MAQLAACESGVARQNQRQSYQNDHQGFCGFHVPSSFLNKPKLRIFCPFRRARAREVYTEKGDDDPIPDEPIRGGGESVALTEHGIRAMGKQSRKGLFSRAVHDAEG